MLKKETTYDNYKFGWSENGGKWSVICYKIKTKARYPKPVFNYFFPKRENQTSKERAEAYVANFIATVDARVKDKQERAEAKKKARTDFVNPYKVGDILYNSWGYDQTNVDFYQVVTVGKKSIKMRKICGETVEGSEGHDCCYLKPIKDKFYSEEVITKIIQVRVSYNNKPYYSIPSRCGSISLYDSGERGTYCSWYR